MTPREIDKYQHRLFKLSDAALFREYEAERDGEKLRLIEHEWRVRFHERRH